MSGKVDDIWSPRLTRVCLTTHSNNISHKWWHFLSSATQKDKAHHRQAKQLRLLPSVQRAPPACQNERQVIWYYWFVLCCPDFCQPPVTLQYSWFPDTQSVGMPSLNVASLHSKSSLNITSGPPQSPVLENVSQWSTSWLDPWITASHWTPAFLSGPFSGNRRDCWFSKNSSLQNTLNTLKQVVFTKSRLSDWLLRYLQEQAIEHFTKMKVSSGSRFHCKDGNYCNWWSRISAWQHIWTVIMWPKKGVGWRHL